jgi:FkbM family methyltransferase
MNRAWDAMATALRPIQFRGKERLTDALFPRTGQSSVSIFGSRFSLDLSDFIQRHMYAGSYERIESQIVRRLLQPGMTFVDVGANVGYYTALAAEAVGSQGRVLAFEPSEYAFPRLKRMVEANRLTWVTPFQCGLAESPGQIVLYGGSEHDAFNNHTATMVPNDNPNRRLVPTDTLDCVAERLDIRRVDMMKIDVDGFEMHVLRGARRLLEESRIAVIMLECSEFWFERMHTSTAEIMEYLKARSFQGVSRMGRSDNYVFTLQPAR